MGLDGYLTMYLEKIKNLAMKNVFINLVRGPIIEKLIWLKKDINILINLPNWIYILMANVLVIQNCMASFSSRATFLTT